MASTPPPHPPLLPPPPQPASVPFSLCTAACYTDVLLVGDTPIGVTRASALVIYASFTHSFIQFLPSFSHFVHLLFYLLVYFTCSSVHSFTQSFFNPFSHFIRSFVPSSIPSVSHSLSLSSFTYCLFVRAKISLEK